MKKIANMDPGEAVQAADAAHHLHPFTDTGALNAEGARVIVSADGVWITDSQGNRVLDGMAGLWCVQVGYGRREIADAAYRQMLELPYYNTFFKTTHPPVARLAEKLATLTPAHMNRVFFTNSGSEANDTVLRLVRHYWNLMGKPGKKTVIARHNAYHGSTMAAASLGGMANMHEQGDLPIPGIHHIAQPYWFGEGGGESPEEFGIRTARALDRAIEEIGEENVAAFIAEPVQGAGGVIVPPESYWPEIRRILDRRDILFIADEVITGFGRLGRWFGSEYYQLTPDLMPIAKGLSSGYLPIAGVVVSDRIAETLISKGEEFFHGFTYSGHPAAAAAALENLRILEEEGIIERVREETAPYLQEKWAILGEHPLVGEARTVGLLAALELVPDRSERHVRFEPVGDVGRMTREISLANGLVMRAVRDTMILSPPLVISRQDIDIVVERCSRTLDEAHALLKRQGKMA